MRLFFALVTIVFCLAAFEAYWDMNFSCDPEKATQEKSIIAQQIDKLAEEE